MTNLPQSDLLTALEKSFSQILPQLVYPVQGPEIFIVKVFAISMMCVNVEANRNEIAGLVAGLCRTKTELGHAHITVESYHPKTKPSGVEHGTDWPFSNEVMK